MAKKVKKLRKLKRHRKAKPSVNSLNILNEIKHVTDRRNHITMAIKFNGAEKEFTVDTGSPVTIIPPDKPLIKDKKTLPITRKNQDVNINATNFTGRIMVEAERRGH